MDHASEGAKFGRFLTRQPFAVFGAIGLMSLAQDLLQLHSWIASWIDAWRSVMHPLWDFLLGNVLARFHLRMPVLLKDYFSVGLIVYGMNLRSRLYEVGVNPSETRVVWHLGPFPMFQFSKSNPLMMVVSSVLDFFEALLLWPGVVVGRVYRAIIGYDLARQKMVVFLETLVWVLVFLALSYGLMHRGG